MINMGGLTLVEGEGLNTTVARSNSNNPPLSALSNSTRPQLDTLPGEIRNEIYKHLQVPHIGSIWVCQKYKRAEIKDFYSLTKVNKQIRMETVSLFYGENTFAIIPLRYQHERRMMSSPKRRLYDDHWRSLVSFMNLTSKIHLEYIGSLLLETVLLHDNGKHFPDLARMITKYMPNLKRVACFFYGNKYGAIERTPWSHGFFLNEGIKFLVRLLRPRPSYENPLFNGVNIFMQLKNLEIFYIQPRELNFDTQTWLEIWHEIPKSREVIRGGSLWSCCWDCNKIKPHGSFGEILYDAVRYRMEDDDGDDQEFRESLGDKIILWDSFTANYEAKEAEATEAASL